MTELKQADAGTIQQYAQESFRDLGDSVAEFGEETRAAIRDTAADRLAEAGYDFNADFLRRIVEEMA